MNTVDNVVLVAPRPVRITPNHLMATRAAVRIVSTPADSFARITLGDDTDEDDDDDHIRSFNVSRACSDKDAASPRLSPRSNLPSDALEEFLSILRPSFFPLTSPILRARRRGSGSLPTFTYERPHPYRVREKADRTHSKSSSTSSAGSEEGERSRSSKRSRSCQRLSLKSLNELVDNTTPVDDGSLSPEWRTGPLSSPISRTETRNPFQRHPSYEAAFTALHSFTSDTPVIASPPATLSPAAIPLPLSDADEEMEMTS